MSASGGMSLDLTVFFFLLFGTVLVQMFPILLRLQRDTCTTALILLMLRGPSSITLYFQTEEGGAAKKKLKALVFLYYNSFISYAYLV